MRTLIEVPAVLPIPATALPHRPSRAPASPRDHHGYSDHPTLEKTTSHAR
jgi:hypothetical protein